MQNETGWLLARPAHSIDIQSTEFGYKRQLVVFLNQLATFILCR